MKKYIFGSLIAMGLTMTVTAFAQVPQGITNPIDPTDLSASSTPIDFQSVVDTSLYQIVVNQPQVVFKGTLAQLSSRRSMIENQIKALQVELNNLNQSYVPVSN